ncbi:hypothetical protein WR25_14162 [Diploscapter pachys]|uniref:DM domain-containing protein n=1 Tax=Diploscapter pachys TaxID=2018661 RepID=A0A2A2JPF9_9BILA|nr:hypothetical protein WR25_14162 [Diploscapter pachys]
MTSPAKSPAECKRFYGLGKKIPKDVKRHCGMCRQHGITVETRGHLCQFKNCDCLKCKLVKQRRSIMSTQIRLRREQDKKFQRTTDIAEADIVPWKGGKSPKALTTPQLKDETNMCYFCQKCKNHGVLMWKKDHKKNCEYANCRCEQCDLIDTRRALDRHIKNNKGSSPARGSLDSNSSTGSSTRESSSEESCSSSAISSLLPTPVPTSIFSISNLMQSSQPMSSPTTSLTPESPSSSVDLCHPLLPATSLVNPLASMFPFPPGAHLPLSIFPPSSLYTSFLPLSPSIPASTAASVLSQLEMQILLSNLTSMSRNHSV